MSRPICQWSGWHGFNSCRPQHELATKHASCFPPGSVPAYIEISIKLIVCRSAAEKRGWETRLASNLKRAAEADAESLQTYYCSSDLNCEARSSSSSSPLSDLQHFLHSFLQHFCVHLTTLPPLFETLLQHSTCIFSCHIPVIFTWSVNNALFALVSAHNNCGPICVFCMHGQMCADCFIFYLTV